LATAEDAEVSEASRSPGDQEGEQREDSEVEEAVLALAPKGVPSESSSEGETNPSPSMVGLVQAD
jgi:hypothetical protein